MRLFLFCITFLFFCESTWSQEFFGDLLSPQAPAWTLRATGEDGYPMTQQKFFLSAPVLVREQDSVTASWKWSQLNLEHDENLPNGGALPGHFYNSEIGVGYRHIENPNHFWGLTSSVGSAGDQIFHSRTKTVWNVTAFYSTTEDPSSRWVWLLNDSNNRTFLNEIPIPGVAYIYRPSADFMGVFGFPFAFIRWKWDELWSSQFVLGPYVYKAEISRSIAGPAQVYVSLDRSVQSYYREDRLEEEDRVFYTESRLLIGAKSPVNKVFYAEIFGGVAFNRTVAEDKNYKLSDSDALNLPKRGLLGAQLTARF